MNRIQEKSQIFNGQFTKEKKRIIFIFICFCLFFLIILFKAFYIQIVNNKKLIEYSQNQTLRQFKVYPHRGNIVDRNLAPLAINIQTYSIFAMPKYIKDEKKDLTTLSNIVPELTFRTLTKKLHKRTRYTWLARKISLSKKQVAGVKKIKGIYIEAVPKRIYPNNELLSQAIGFVGLDNVGLSGMEYLFDKELRGEAKVVKYLRDAKGRPIKFERVKKNKPSLNLTLSIEKDLQGVAEKALKEAVVYYKALKGGIGIMDSSNGEILAIANYPSYDPNNLKGSKPENRRLSFISDPFEPGSIFKIFTMASALEFKIARPDTNYYCERGSLRIGDHYINEAEAGKKHEWLSVSEILKYSSNIGTTKIAFDLTFPKLKKTIEDFNFGLKTDIEIPGESRGIFNTRKNISPLKLSNISFGQGIATTGVQVLAAYAAIANGGIYYKPTILKREKPPKGLRVLSKQTAEELTAMLIEAVDDGTGQNAKIPYFKIAGKTSTAQKPSKGGGYQGYISGFIGYPVNVDKKFVIYVYIDSPQGRTYYGNAVAAPVFKKVAQYFLYKNKDFNHLSQTKPASTKTFDSVKIKHASTRIMKKGQIPNFIGLDKVSSRQLGIKLKLKVVHKGIGVVTSQNPKASSKIDKDTIVKLIYSPPQYD